MFEKCIWVLIFTTLASAHGESTPGILQNLSSLRSLSNPTSSRAQWAYRPQEDYNRHATDGISHGSTGSSETGPSQEYWWYNYTNPSYYDYVKPSYGYTGSTGYLYKNPVEKLHSKYAYQLKRPPTSYTAIKKYPVYYKDKHQVLSLDASGKPRYKKTTLNQSVFPRVTKPHSKIKYPTQSHPTYKRYYYQSPYQRYAIPMSDMLRYKYINSTGSYYKGSSNQDVTRYTTERMDDAYPDGTAAWDDYSTYNDTSTYEETYEEVDKSTSDPDKSSYEEGTTRGYYGDRIYMSTQVPLVTSDKTGVKNKYFIIRRTSDDDDIETLFE